MRRRGARGGGAARTARAGDNLIGEAPASSVYVQSKHKQCVKARMRDMHWHLSADTTQAVVAVEIDRLAVDPRHPFATTAATPTQRRRTDRGIPPDKDVDGLTETNAGRLALGRPGLRPCTPAGVLRLLDEIDTDLAGVHAVVVGRSALVGKPMAQLLLQRNATVTTCHSRTHDLAAVTRQADVIVVATGVPQLIGADAASSAPQ